MIHFGKTHTPDIIYQHIADIFNRVASESDCPKGDKLAPLQKPKGPVSNLTDPSSSYQHYRKY